MGSAALRHSVYRRVGRGILLVWTLGVHLRILWGLFPGLARVIAIQSHPIYNYNPSFEGL